MLLHQAIWVIDLLFGCALRNRFQCGELGFHRRPIVFRVLAPEPWEAIEPALMALVAKEIIGIRSLRPRSEIYRVNMGAPGYERVAEKPLRKASGRVPSADKAVSFAVLKRLRPCRIRLCGCFPGRWGGVSSRV